MLNLVQAIPTMPVYDPNRLGGYGGADNLSQRAITLNPIGWQNLVDSNGYRDRFIGNIWGEFEIVKGLRYTLRASADQLHFGNRLFIPPSDLGWYYITENAESSLDVDNGKNQRTIVDNLLNYDATFGKHKIEALAGWVQERSDYYRHWGRGVGFEPGEIAHLDYAEDDEAGEYESTETRISFLARINYDYNDRYLLQANWRQDKTSLFREQINKGDFYSFSGAWKLHNDIKLPSWWNTAKIRAGYGKIGNNTVPIYYYSPTVNAFAGYNFGNALAPGVTTVTRLDPNITWETTTTVNGAVELGMFNNKLQLTAEYFVKTSDDVLAAVPLPLSTGSFPANITTNAAKIRNKGFEFVLSYNNNDNDFKYGISANVGTLKNEVLEIGEDDLPITYSNQNSRTEVGRSLGEIYAFETEGIFQNQAEIDAHAFQANAAPGDVKFRDVNGDGQINDEDRTFQGTTIPKINYGLNLNASYKGFDLSLFFQGAAGHKIYNGTYNSLMIGGLTNHHTDMLDYWSPDNTDTNVPRPTYLDLNGNARGSDRFIEKGDYVRLQAVEFGYTLPPVASFIQKARIYVSGQNLFTITDYSGYDPDFNNGTVPGANLFTKGYELGSFPNPRGFMFGVDITL